MQADADCAAKSLANDCLMAEVPADAASLHSGVVHQFQIAAENADGRGEWSSIAEVMSSGMKAAPADAPATFTAAADDGILALAWTSSASQFRVSWRESASGGNSPGAWQGWLDDPADADAEYIRGDNDDGVGVESAAPHAFTITGLINDVSYDARVAAVSGGVTGAWTSAVTKIVNPPSMDASLTSLVISDGELVPVFAAETLTYTAHVRNAVTEISVTAAAADSGASVVVAGGASLTDGENEIEISVTAEDAIAMQTYLITVTRAEKFNMNANADAGENINSADAIIIARYLLGVRGDALIDGHAAAADGADGIMIARYIFGLREDMLIGDYPADAGSVAARIKELLAQ